MPLYSVDATSSTGIDVDDDLFSFVDWTRTRHKLLYKSKVPFGFSFVFAAGGEPDGSSINVYLMHRVSLVRHFFPFFFLFFSGLIRPCPFQFNPSDVTEGERIFFSFPCYSICFRFIFRFNRQKDVDLL